MSSFAATAARTASEPEWWKVPSPRFCTKCATSTNGAAPIHCAPSLPICVIALTRPWPWPASITIVWQPMPAPTIASSGATVLVLCGQPEQKNGVRCAPSSAGVRAATASRRSSASRTPGVPADEQARADHARDRVDVERAVHRHQRRPAVVAHAQHRRCRGAAVERVADEALQERALLLDHDDLLEAGGELADDLRVQRRQHADRQQAHGGAAEVGERAQGVVDGRSRGDDTDTRGRVVVDDPVERVQARRRGARARCGDRPSCAPSRARGAEAASARARGRRARPPIRAAASAASRARGRPAPWRRRRRRS